MYTLLLTCFATSERITSCTFESKLRTFRSDGNCWAKGGETQRDDGHDDSEMNLEFVDRIARNVARIAEYNMKYKASSRYRLIECRRSVSFRRICIWQAMVRFADLTLQRGDFELDKNFAANIFHKTLERSYSESVRALPFSKFHSTRRVTVESLQFQ